MRLSRIYIDNFRNLRKFKMMLSEFEVLAGENNIGKTNIMHSINNVLSLDRRTYFDNQDFSDPEKPIIIELTFSDFSTPEEEAIFFDHEGIKNPEADEVKVKLKAEWDEKERDINVSLVFIREDLPEEEKEIKEFSWYFRRYVPYYYISAYREVEKEITSKRGDLFEILQSFTPYQIMPIQTLKKKTLAKIDDLLGEIEKINRDELASHLLELKSTVAKVEEATKEEMESLIDILESIKHYVENSDEIEERQLLAKMLKQTKELIAILQNRASIQNKLSILKEEFKNLYGLENLENSLNKLLSEFLADENLTLDTISAKDEDFLRQLNVGVGEYPILKHGSGYQSILSLILKLFKSLYHAIKREEIEFRSFIIAVEEPESHLHPHLQRHLIKALKNIQAKFSEEGLSLQFIVSTHSPFVITPLTFDNLTFLRLGEDTSPYSIKIDKNQFAQEIVKELNITDEIAKRKKKNQIGRWLEHLFYDCPEIFFSKCVIIGEGATEQGAIPVFSEKIRKSLDRFGVSFLNGEGDNLIYPLKLLKALRTRWILVVDKDKIKSLEPFIDKDKDYVFPTNEKAFESEIISKVPLSKILQALDIKSIPERNQERINQLKGIFPTLKGKGIESLQDALTHLGKEDVEKFKSDLVLKWMKDEKGLSFGRILAELLEEDEISEVFVKAINKAVEGSKREYKTHETDTGST